MYGNKAPEYGRIAKKENPNILHVRVLYYDFEEYNFLLTRFFRPHLWEQQHILDAGLVGHQHHQTVDTNTNT